jgi:hypothetical protein
MSAKHLGAIGLAAVFAVSSAFGVQLTAKGDSVSQLSRYYTFFILQGNSSGSSVTDQRIREDLEAALNSRGWVDVPRDEAQAVVVVHAATGTIHSYKTLYEGWGGWSWQDSPGAAAGVARDYKPGTLIVDIFDANSKEALWSGLAVGAASDALDRSGHATQQAVVRMFRSFPAAEPIEDQASPERIGALSSPGRDVPRIIFGQAPASLILVDGEPDYREIARTELERVVNTRPFIVRDTDGMHYLKIADGWMQAYSLTGMWAVADTVPQEAKAALVQAVDAKTVDLLEGGSLGSPDDQSGPSTPSIPAIYVSTTPATLIVTEGEPQFAPMEGTSLLYIRNTTAHVLQEPTDQELYAFLSGGWFRAWTPEGPWQRISLEQLPADLTNVPGIK